MATQRDYYEVLGVAKSATDAEIKKAFRRAAMKCHPDRNSNKEKAAKDFKELNEAYQVLSDPQKRQQYDQFGHAGINQQGGSGFQDASHININDIFSGFGDFGDIFEELFNQGRPSAHRRQGSIEATPGADLRYDLTLSLEQAVSGTTVDIEVHKQVRCESCQGSGAKAGTKPTICKQCNGHGQVQMQQGFMIIRQTCPVCRGTGKIIGEPCATCHGEGRHQGYKKLSIIPAGVDDDDRIRLKGEGEAGAHGGNNGNLYVHIKLKKHSIFNRHDDDLYCTIPVSFATATLGGHLEIPTLNGRVKIKIPSGTQSGKRFRLRGKGVKSVRSHHTGDMLCQVIIETPVNLDNQQKKLLKDFDGLVQKNINQHSPQSKTFFERVKHFFETIKNSS